MSVFDSLERSESERITRILHETSWGNTVRISQCNKLYDTYLKKHNTARMNMSIIDKLAFERRLYTMAKREVMSNESEPPFSTEDRVETNYEGSEIGSLRIRAKRSDEE